MVSGAGCRRLWRLRLFTLIIVSCTRQDRASVATGLSRLAAGHITGGIAGGAAVRLFPFQEQPTAVDNITQCCVVPVNHQHHIGAALPLGQQLDQIL